VADCFAPPKAKLIGLFHWVASGNRQERDRERALKDGYFHLSFCLIPIMETKERERERERERQKGGKWYHMDMECEHEDMLFNLRTFEFFFYSFIFRINYKIHVYESCRSNG
jgi:hypothetical protein